MITKLTHLMLLVHNQNDALKFYTEQLNFKIHPDAQFGPERWLTICAHNQSDFEIALMHANDQEKDLVGRQAGSKPFFVIETDNCIEDYKLFQLRGIHFLSEPKEELWGTSALFQDLYGNIILLNQSK
ncbi:MAG: VOC family protein [Candidatus Dependentiae bacterium]